MTCRVIALVLTVIAVGCGPTRTAGTEKLSRSELAVLTIRKHNTMPGTQINAVKFDNGMRYDIKGNRSFYLTPGDHEIAVGIGPSLQGASGWFSSMEDITVFIPASTGMISAGKTYELRTWTEGLQSPDEFVSRVAEEVEP